MCAGPSKSYTGTLNPDTLIELDDTALDIKMHAQQSKEGENKWVYSESEGESETEINMAYTETEGEIDRNNNRSTSINFHVDKGSLSQPSKESVKWGKRREEINAK